MEMREFTLAGEYHYNRSGAVRWILSHIARYPVFWLGFVLAYAAANALFSAVPVLVGAAFTVVLQPHPVAAALIPLAAGILGLIVAQFVLGTAGAFSGEVLAQRLERDSRDELYLSLLGKSQTFHNRQQVGDVMAHANNDVRQLNAMMNPGIALIFDSFLNILVPLIFIALLNPQLLLVPVIFVIAFVISLRLYTRRLSPIAGEMRAQFGRMNGRLAETVSGIEVVKATAQEAQEKAKFAREASRYRDLYVRNGEVQARYLPLLIYAVALMGAFLHGVLLVTHGQLSIGGLITYMGLFGLMRFATGESIFTFSLVQLGIAGANRILALMRQETELDETADGYAGTMRGKIVFDHVTFGYGDTPVLRDVSFTVEPGQTVALVGQTGSGKSTILKLLNRIYDVREGRVLVDGVDVRDWNLGSLRSQISIIEQDIFLFSKSIRENISFGLGQRADFAAIQQAAREAQAHEFIVTFKDGYDTVIGERGVTLSGGQRQRLAIARAMLTDPRVLLLDDSTSAIDSATEDEIQQAIKRLQEGRTTLLITHRLSQIRWADKILVLQRGELITQGSHDELMRTSDLYRRIFTRYESAPSSSAALSASVPSSRE